MLKIKLQHRGKKHQRTYDIVVSESCRKRDGRFLKYIGFYLPQKKQVYINKINLKWALNHGAYATSTVRHLLNWAINISAVN